MVMEDFIQIREKAIRFAVRTGDAPDLDLVWDTQQHEGQRRCFGCYEPSCSTACRWLMRCQQVAREPTHTPLPRPAREGNLPPHQAERFSEDRWVPPSLRRQGGTVRRPRPL